MSNYIIEDVWEPPENKPWSFEGDNGTVTLKTYWLTLAEKDGPTGIKCRIHQKPETEAPKRGDALNGELIEKTSKAGKDYLQFKKSQAFLTKCPDCGHEFDAKANKPGQQARPAPDAPAQTPLGGSQSDSKPSNSQTGTQTHSDDEPPLSNYDDIPF